MDENLEEKFNRQEKEQYLAIGRFVVQFEHLFYAVKQKLSLLCGFPSETKLLLEPYTVRQTIDALRDIIDWRTQDWNKESADIVLYKFLIKDLTQLNQDRNGIIHTTWFIGWRSESITDLTEFKGFKFSSPFNFKVKNYTAHDIDLLTERCKVFYQIFYTVWSIDPIVSDLDSFSSMWQRTPEGKWVDLRRRK